MKIWKVYKHTNIKNGKSYIGITCAKDPNKRWANGKGYCSKNHVFYAAIQKYGWENFSHEILVDNIKTLEEANKLEQEYIKVFHTWIRDPKCMGYNMTTGGSGRAHTQSLETKQKISASLSGRKKSEEHRIKIIAALKRKPIICIETGIKYESASEAARQTGIKRENIKTALNGERLSAGGYHWAEINNVEKIKDLTSLNGKCKAAKKKVICVETGVIYESIASAARSVGVASGSAISNAITKHNKCKGYHWEYLEKN